MRRFCLFAPFRLAFLIFFAFPALAGTGSLEIDDSGRVTIHSVLRLTAGADLPDSPLEGDIRLTEDKHPAIYLNGRWIAIALGEALAGGGSGEASPVSPDIKIRLTQGSGTWTVPEGVDRISVWLAGGGGGGGMGRTGCQAGGKGGNGEITVRPDMDVTPGQVFSYAVGPGGNGGGVINLTVIGAVRRLYRPGTSGQATTFGEMSAAGGGAGTAGAPGADGPAGGLWPDGARGLGGDGASDCDGHGAGSGDSGAVYIAY